LALSPAGAAPPNVLVLLADDLRADALGCYGDRVVKTPNIDELARRGTIISNAYVMGSMQGAVCVPSRAMFLSGRTLFHVSEKLDNPRHVLWPEAMHKAGYRDYYIGKWHNGPASFARACKGGDAIFFGGMSDQLKIALHTFSPEGKYPKENQYIGSKFSTELFADSAVEFLKQTPKETPFYLYVAFTSPHDPRTPPAKHRYHPAKVELPRSFMVEHPFDNGEMKVRDEQLAPWPRTPEVIQQHIADYYGMISHLDAEVGRILNALRETGREENTIVVFAGDNGLAVGRHGLMGKQNLYEHSIRVPLIFAGPEVPRWREARAMCYLLDVFPTVCELAGIETPASVEGQSLVPVMAAKKQHARDEIFGAYREVQRMIKDERWKLIRYPQVDKTQLFDLQSDPHELTNLADKPEHKDRAAKMLQRLAALQQELGDPLK